MVKRLEPNMRRNLIADAAFRVAKREGLLAVTNFDMVASEVEIETSAATVRRYFPTGIVLMRAAAKRDEKGGPVRAALSRLEAK